MDDAVPVLQRMFEKRRRGYLALGYGTDPLLPLKAAETRDPSSSA